MFRDYIFIKHSSKEGQIFFCFWTAVVWNSFWPTPKEFPHVLIINSKCFRDKQTPLNKDNLTTINSKLLRSCGDCEADHCTTPALPKNKLTTHNPASVVCGLAIWNVKPVLSYSVMWGHSELSTMHLSWPYHLVFSSQAASAGHKTQAHGRLDQIRQPLWPLRRPQLRSQWSLRVKA